MESLQLIQQLYNNEPGIRRQAALVIGTVKETGALMALQQRVREEPDDNVKRVIMWAGKRVQQAETHGFSTIDAIFDYFKIDREIQSGIDPEEAELLRHQTNVAGSIQSGGVFSDIKLGSTMTADSIKTGRLGQRRIDKKSQLRLPTVKPSDTNIQVKIKQLMNSEDARRQKNAALALREMNNPDALPYLALVYYRNENPQLQETIEKSTKALYWSVNYYHMEQNGRLNLEIAKRRRDIGHHQKPVQHEQKPMTEPTKQVSVTDILSQAQAKKRKKHKR